ncbi:hypothetical protein P4H66_24665 [Paenibacillus dokdonensis]|uniref:N-terminal domain of peptidoglycan hydrolase CwlO-containing protein n=1 Tax=Paenibacillus dokdonensis TaxID=2567944 RepID=A0ABU6GXV0_9BACL|nr:hypothetical protein [Paenibacillus dokdonensis]MEC0243007.1 hypothetical protein [Paenibacillus dokdonensis]
MKAAKKHVRLIYLLLPLLFLSLLHPEHILLADPVKPETADQQQMLQKSLSIVEIDHEIDRITRQQDQTQTELEKLQVQLEEKQQQIKSRQERAGTVIRSYYMGERDNLFTILFSAKNISNLLEIYSYYEMIMDQDAMVLNAYQSQYQSIKETQQLMEKSYAQLTTLKDNLLKQRDRVLALQKDLDSSIADSSDPEAMKKMIKEFTAYWENVGMYEVKRYFSALSSAMNDLPEFIQNKKGALRTNGTTYSIEIQEDDLNDFLKSKNELFNNFSFHFNDNKVIAEGESGNLSLQVEGHYSVENEPENSILFHVDKLVFNGLELPDTTCRQLENEFDLGFYPQQIVSFVKATEVTSTNQVLHVTLKLSM